MSTTNHFIKLIIATFICVATSYAQSDQKNKLKILVKQTQQNSFSDSTSVFSSGKKCIELARKLKDYSTEADIYIYYGNYFAYNEKFEKAKQYYTKANQLAKKANNHQIERLARIRLAYLLNANGEEERATSLYKQIIKESVAAKDYKNEIEAINALATSSDYRNKPTEITKLYLHGLKIAEKNNLNYYRATILNNLGLIKIDIGQIDEALADFRLAVELAEKEENPRLTYHALNNVGYALSIKNKTNDAIVTYVKTLAYARKMNHPRELSTAYLNLGSIYIREKKIDKALIYINCALVVFREYNLKYELSMGLLSKAETLIQSEKIAEAEKSIYEALNLATETKDLNTQAEAHRFIHRIRKQQNNYKAALEEYVMYKTLLDSFQLITNAKHLRELQIKYEVEKKDNALKEEKAKSQILAKENELRKAKQRSLIFIGVFLVVLIVAIFYIRNIRQIKKQQVKFSQELIKNIEEERSRIARDLHDDLGQSLSAIKSKLNLESQNRNKELQELEKEVGKIIDLTREISHTLYPSYLEKIGLTRSVARLMEKVQQSTNLECSFELTDDIEKIGINNCTHLYRIIQECVNNTIKHANASALKVSITKKGNLYTFSYMDNGKGILNKVQTKGIGFLSMNERARMINGEMHVEDSNGKGFKLIIKFNG